MRDDRSTAPCNAPLRGGLRTPAVEMQKISIEKWYFNEERFFPIGKSFPIGKNKNLKKQSRGDALTSATGNCMSGFAENMSPVHETSMIWKSFETPIKKLKSFLRMRLTWITYFRLSVRHPTHCAWNSGSRLSGEMTRSLTKCRLIHLTFVHSARENLISKLPTWDIVGAKKNARFVT